LNLVRYGYLRQRGHQAFVEKSHFYGISSA
jgi:hypothetical protein